MAPTRFTSGDLDLVAHGTTQVNAFAVPWSRVSLLRQQRLMRKRSWHPQQSGRGRIIHRSGFSHDVYMQVFAGDQVTALLHKWLSQGSEVAVWDKDMTANIRNSNYAAQVPQFVPVGSQPASDLDRLIRRVPTRFAEGVGGTGLSMAKVMRRAFRHCRTHGRTQAG